MQVLDIEILTKELLCTKISEIRELNKGDFR